MTHLLCRFVRDESAATAIEYGLIAALISLAIFAGVGSFAGSLGSLWDGNTGKITEAFNR
jgi:pilus assembly protein Flp/PilA